jgi:hypothetical protein
VFFCAFHQLTVTFLAWCVPVGASAAEIWATSDLLVLIEEAKKEKPINARMAWTRHRSHTKLAQDQKDGDRGRDAHC